MAGLVEDEGRGFPIGETPTIIGREHPAFAHYSALASSHASVRLSSAGATIADLGSGDGTVVNGLATGGRRLAPGDYVRLGPCGFIVIEGEGPDGDDEDVIGWSPAAARLRRERDAVVTAFRGPTCPSRTLLVVGEPGVGKHMFCAALATRLGARIVRDIDASDGERAEEHVRLIRQAEQPLLATSTRALGDPGFPASLRAYFPWSVVIPPLRTRPEDVVPFVRRHLARMGAAEKRIDGDLLQRLFSAEWRGNVRALCTEVERLHALDPDESVLMDCDGVHVDGRDVVPRISHDASSVRVAERLFDFRRRRVLRNVLRALTTAHLAGRSLSVSEVAALAWPGEKMHAPAANNRVYVAMASLRKLGLHSWIESAEGGYSLVRGVVIE